MESRLTKFETKAEDCFGRPKLLFGRLNPQEVIDRSKRNRVLKLLIEITKTACKNNPKPTASMRDAGKKNIADYARATSAAAAAATYEV